MVSRTGIHLPQPPSNPAAWNVLRTCAWLGLGPITITEKLYAACVRAGDCAVGRVAHTHGDRGSGPLAEGALYGVGYLWGPRMSDAVRGALSGSGTDARALWRVWRVREEYNV